MVTLNTTYHIPIDNTPSFTHPRSHTFRCLAIIVFNHVFLGINWALFSLLRPRREKALKDREDDAKRLANKVSHLT